LACKNNPLAKYTKQYNCQIAGEPAPQTSEEYFKRAGKHMEENGYSAAFDECAFGAVSEGLKLDPQNANGFAVRGFLYKARAEEFVSKNESNAAKNDFESALEDLNEAIRLAPDQWLYYDTRSSIYQESGFLDPDSEKALRDLSKAIELSPGETTLISLFVKRGDLYSAKKDYENAVKDYTEAIKRESNDKDFYSKRAAAYEKLGRKDLAEADFIKHGNLEWLEKCETSPSPDKTVDSNSNQPIVKPISGGVLNEKAVNLPKPVYPEAAKANRIGGVIRVRVEVDETGNVTSAKAISNLPFFSKEDIEQTARAAKFKPAILNGKPVKVSGVIVYDFVPE